MGPPWGIPLPAETPDPNDGPIAVVADIVIEGQHRNDLAQFIEVMLELRLAYLRNGASSARLYKNLGALFVFRMEAVAPTWREYLLLHTRLTKTERQILDRVFNLSAELKPKVHYYVLINPDAPKPSGNVQELQIRIISWRTPHPGARRTHLLFLIRDQP